tara:strand:- start:576 stop:809 length:234 start_codon:yes stop_codon:yes gene_type:complete
MDKNFYKAQYGILLSDNAKLKNDNEKLKQQVLELTMENAELKDVVLDNGGDYTETDGYEVGSAEDYEQDNQLNLFND